MRRLSRRIAVTLVALLICCLPLPAARAGGPIGNWKLSGSFKNSADTQLTMTDTPAGSTGFVTTNVNGKNKTVVVVGSGDGLKIAHVPVPARTHFTIDVFFITPEVTTFERFLSFGPNDRDDGLYVSGGHVQLYPGVIGSNVSVVINTWTHIRVTRSSATDRVKVYVDGSLEINYPDPQNDFTLRKGQAVLFQDDASEHMYGMIKNVRVWDHPIAP